MRGGLLATCNRYGMALNTAVFGVLAALTWDRLGDLLIDFPHELYNAWLVAQEGRVPYRDFAYIYGPLPLAWNAAMLRVLGNHNHGIQASNLAIAALACVSLWRIFAHAWGRTTANLATVAFQFLSVFSALPLCTNFNFVAPYSHAVTVGMAAALGALAFFAQGLEVGAKPRSSRWWLASFVCASATLLTKPEIAVACWLALLTGHAFRLRLKPTVARGCEVRSILTLAIVAAIGVAACATSLAMLHYVAREIPSVLGAAFAAISPTALSGLRQQAQLGTDAPAANLLRMLAWGSAGLLYFGAAILWGYILGQKPVSRGQIRLLSVLSFLPLPLFVLSEPAFAYRILIEKLPRGIPMWTLLGLGMVFIQLLRIKQSRGNTTTGHKIVRSKIVVLVWGIFATLLLSRMWLNPRMNEYGFYQAVPALLFSAAVANHALQQRHIGNAVSLTMTRAMLGGLALAFLLAHVGKSAVTLREKSYLVETPTLRLYTLPPPRHPNADAIVHACRDLMVRLGPGETFAALPGGSIIHYITQRSNPVFYHQLGPYEVALYGEEKILAAYASAAPNFIALVHRPYFGYPPLLTQRFTTWLRANYAPVALYGQPPFTREDSYGVEIWKRGSPQSQAKRSAP
ncbi:MAG: hypothetical protein ACP5UB_11070 [Candidatus Sumerlaeaceae bacterium]